MINQINLKKVSDILNSEGCILGLYIDPKNNFYFSSFLKDSTGIVFYSVHSNLLRDYLQSKITLSDLYKESKSFLVQHKFKTEIKTFLKEDIIDVLQCGNDFYKDLPDSMKSKEIEKQYGN